MLAYFFGLHKASKWLGRKNFSARVLEKIQARIGLRKAKLEEHINARRDLPGALILTSGCYHPRPSIEPFFRALRLRDAQAVVDEFEQTHFASRRVIGVHVRYHSRAMGESDHDRFWERPDESLAALWATVQRLRERFAPDPTIVFLATDSARVQNFFREGMPDVIAYEKQFTLDGKELHEHLPIKTAQAALVDMFLLARCDVLVRYPPGTWFSYYASLFVSIQETVA